MAEVSSQTLHIVARELASELNEARASLEAFGEQQENLALLRKCNEHLHSVHGALRVAEVYGAALLAEEMGQVARYLIDNFAEKRHLAEGLDALMRAMVQLPTYLERVISGGRDMALVLLPLLNDLRAVRGHALLSEGTLLLLNLSSDQQANPVAAATGEGALSVGQWARKLRTRFQLGLLGWIKNERVEQNLEILSRAAEKLEQVATTQPVFQLWWVVGAVLEALREGGLEGSASVKRLLGQADRDMKRLYELGESRYSDSPALELMNNLLYYVARARTSGPRVAAVRASFRLTELLPVDDNIEQARESLSAPSVKLMKTVAAAINHLLAQVELRVERLGLLQQPVDQLLGAADGQRRDVVDRFLRVQLAALSARMLERIDHVGADAEQAELENLEQPAGTGADDDDVGLNRAVDGDAGLALAQEHSPRMEQARRGARRARRNSIRAQPECFRVGALRSSARIQSAVSTLSFRVQACPDVPSDVTGTLDKRKRERRRGRSGNRRGARWTGASCAARRRPWHHGAFDAGVG